MPPRAIASICFFAPQAYPVISGDRNLKVVGGAEVQQSILARELARRGYRVTMVCYDYGQGSEVVIDGVRILASHRPGAGLPKTQTLQAYAAMWRAMARADADLYYQQNCSAITGLMAAFARVHGRLALYCGAHDLDFVANLPLLPTARDRWLYRFGLRRMDAIAAQSPRQVESCRRDMGLDSEVIRSFYGHKGQPADPDGTVLWIARVHPTKGAELFVELARRCPERRFRLVGGGEADYFASIQALAVGVPNLELTGFVPYREVEPMFDGIAVHVSTSKFEGFPNTFLQAWSRGVPTISFFDPDAKVQGRPTGVVVADLDEMVVALRRLNDDRALWRQHSADVKHYFDQTFALDAVADQYERLFERLAATPRGRARLRN